MSHFKSLKLFGLLFGATLISYAYVLNGDFIGDDIDRIVLSPELRSYLWSLTGGLADRPLVMLIVTSISKAFGKEVIAYRLFSILLHSLVALQIYKTTLELNDSSENVLKKQIAVFTAFMFVLHPLNSQSITTAIQVGVILSGLFGLLAFKYFFRGISDTTKTNLRRSTGYFLLGILSKPNLIFLPIIFALNYKKIDGNTFKRLKYLSIYILITLIPLFYYFLFKRNVQYNKYPPIAYFLTQTEVLFTYFKLMVLPTGLRYFYDFNIPYDLNSTYGVFSSLNWLYFFAHVLIITVAYFKLPTRLLWTLFICFYLSFIPESSFFPINHLAFEHRTYFSLIFLFLFLGSWIIHLDLNATFGRLILIGTVAISLFYIILNQGRNVEIKRWGTWAAHTLNHSVNHEYSNFSMAFLLARSKNFELLEPISQRYLALFPDKNYDVVTDFIGFYKYPEKREYYLNKFIGHLENNSLNFTARIIVIKVIFEEFAQKSNSLVQLVKIETTLSNQLDFLFGNGNPLVIAGRQAYAGMASFLLTNEQFKKDYPIQFLKVKALSHLYYNKKFDHLEEDVAIALKQEPQNLMLQKLKKMLDSKRK